MKTHKPLGLSSSQPRGGRTEYVVRCTCGASDGPPARTPAAAQAIFDRHLASNTYVVHTLHHADTTFHFAEVGDQMHVSEWFGQEVRGVQVMGKPEARIRWRTLCRAGAKHGQCDWRVDRSFAGVATNT